MGNAFVCSIHPDNGVTLEAGRQFTGKVFVHVTRKAKAFPATLVMEGIESHVKCARTFYKVVVNLQGPHWQGKLQPGHYAFPFSINLPSSLPSSFNIQQFCEIRYTTNLLASETRSRRSMVAASLNLVVRSAPLPNELIPIVIPPQTFDIKTLRGTLSGQRGLVTLAARVDDAHVGRGAFLRIYLAGYNSSPHDISNVCLELTETIYLIHPSRNPDRSIKKKRNLFLPNSFTIQGLTRGDQDLSEEETNRIVHQRLLSGENPIDIKIPPMARDSYEGQIIKIQHVLKIKFLTGAFVKNPRIDVPLRIGRPPAESVAQATAIPVTANAQVLEPGGLSYDEQEIPMVSATPIFSSAPIEAPTAEEEIVVVGGDTIVYSERGLGALDDYIELEALPVPVLENAEPSMERLLREMTVSIYDYDIIAGYLADPDWVAFFKQIGADDFANIIGHVNVDPDQSRVARLLAPYLHGGTGVPSEFIAAAIRNTAQSHRINLVEALLPFRSNPPSQTNLIRDALTQWELVVLESRL